jgi:hypothetical protein
MSSSITRKTLEDQLNRLNSKLLRVSDHSVRSPRTFRPDEAAHIKLSLAERRGDYCLYYHGSHIVTPRMSGREMYQYLNGALDWIS